MHPSYCIWSHVHIHELQLNLHACSYPPLSWAAYTCEFHYCNGDVNLYAYSFASSFDSCLHIQYSFELGLQVYQIDNHRSYHSSLCIIWLAVTIMVPYIIALIGASVSCHFNTSQNVRPLERIIWISDDKQSPVQSFMPITIGAFVDTSVHHTPFGTLEKASDPWSWY